MKVYDIDKYEFDRMTREERDELFWALLRYLNLNVNAVKYDGDFKTEYEFRREE